MELTRAQWTSAYMDNLPDSSFLYIEPGGKKDGEGKTKPRSLRHFPVKDAQGNPDPAHIRNALSRIPQSNVSASAKASATAAAQKMLKSSSRSDMDTPPRDDLVRTTSTFELKRSEGSDMPILSGTAAVFGEWTEIRSNYEGHFFERFMPGSFKKTISENRSKIRCLFHHGQDPSIGFKPLGPITRLAEENGGLRYDVQLLDTDYNRQLIPGLEAGLYGSSFRFGVVQKNDVRTPERSAWNPKRILQRTITDAYLRELGPTPLPAYAGTSAGVRSLTDEFVLARFPTEELLRRLLGTEQPTRADIESVSILTQMYQLGQAFISVEDDPDDQPDIAAMNTILSSLGDLISTEAQEDEAGEPADADEMMNGGRDTADAPSSDAVLTGTSDLWRAADKDEPTPLWGLNRDEEEVTPAWRL
jgi:HK97 family phage prohead protease